MTKTLNNNIVIILLCACFFISCDKKRVFDTYTSVSSSGWEANSTIDFNFEVNDTIQPKNLFINIRNNNDYDYSNLFLITELNFPDGQKIIDTLEYDMADKTGKFLGTGFSEIKENKLFYKENITFPATGNYTFKVSQAMRKNGKIKGIAVLEGITEVGFRIEKTQ
ncbi:gliding motility lipoprotein GldH [Tenacibaculum geojense]|uniref:Gliding motility lipoprotein GldH n=1 Tax=Tenacibaculum geojense TaxID=915352 RepID=A0ABW3JRR0_9FLAO